MRPEQFVQRLIAPDRLGEGRAGLVFGERRDLAAIGVGESLASRRRRWSRSAAKAGSSGRGVEIVEAPFG